MDTGNPTEIILVHGLWFGAWAMGRLGRLLERDGVSVRGFDYRSTRGNLQSHARSLHDFAKESTAGRQHFVGHSLGGLVILNMLSEFKDIAPGRVVLLGSPLRGSVVARRAGKVPGASRLMGQLHGALESGYTQIPTERSVGMIAGSRPFGLGWMVGGTSGPGDGTVAVAETIVQGEADHCVLPVTHSGLPFSKKVAEKTARFLETGGFEGDSA